MKKAVQQIMLGTVTGTEKEAVSTLQSIKKAGYDGIELNGFMIRPASLLVRALTSAAGMPTGNGGKLNWKKIVTESGLSVVAIHEDLGSIERDTESVIEEAKCYGTDKIVITGMYRFDYSDESMVKSLCQRMNAAGEKLLASGIKLLYHNHNIEFMKLKGQAFHGDYIEHKGQVSDGDFMKDNAYGLIISETDPAFLNFEMDSYWIADAGVDPLLVMDRLGDRLKLYHINDRGVRISKTPMTPIVKPDSMELGYGSMNLKAMVDKAKEMDTEAIILESHRNWIDKDPIKSLTVSADFLNRNI